MGIGPHRFPKQSDALRYSNDIFLFTGKLNMTTLSCFIFILTLLQKNYISFCLGYFCLLIVNVTTACTFSTEMTICIALYAAKIHVFNLYWQSYLNVIMQVIYFFRNMEIFNVLTANNFCFCFSNCSLHHCTLKWYHYWRLSH